MPAVVDEGVLARDTALLIGLDASGFDTTPEGYRARLATRRAGHPGEAYIPELIDLNQRAAPTGRGPAFDVDTTVTLPFDAIMAWLEYVML